MNETANPSLEGRNAACRRWPSFRSGEHRPVAARRRAHATGVAAGLRHAVVLAAALALPSLGAELGEVRNWYDDPFFRVTSDIPRCPEPAGPRVTEADRRLQSHHRAEKGTTCWLAKEDDCLRSSAYAYDRDIAAEIQAAAQRAAPFANTSLWVTVQGRIVYIEGCVRDESQAQAIEAMVRRLPHVQQAIAIITAKPQGTAPYRLLRAR